MRVLFLLDLVVDAENHLRIEKVTLCRIQIQILEKFIVKPDRSFFASNELT